jgi:hypothetical protein
MVEGVGQGRGVVGEDKVEAGVLWGAGRREGTQAIHRWKTQYSGLSTPALVPLFQLPLGYCWERSKTRVGPWGWDLSLPWPV